MDKTKGTVQMVASGYDWVCDQCEEENTECGIPVIGTAFNYIKCKGCGAMFECGGADHNYIRTFD